MCFAGASAELFHHNLFATNSLAFPVAQTPICLNFLPKASSNLTAVSPLSSSSSLLPSLGTAKPDTITPETGKRLNATRHAEIIPFKSPSRTLVFFFIEHSKTALVISLLHGRIFTERKHRRRSRHCRIELHRRA